MLRFLAYFFAALFAQIAFLVAFVVMLNVLDIKNPGVLGDAIFWAYLWPLLVLPASGGHSHGGELFFSPFTAAFYAFIFAMLMSIRAGLLKRSAR